MTAATLRSPSRRTSRYAGRGKTEPVLGFDHGPLHHRISLRQVLEVARYLMDLRSRDSGSPAKRFVRYNRKHTVVFDLDAILAFCDERKDSRQKSCFLLLDKRIGQSRIGVLVPGVITERDQIPASATRASEEHDPTSENMPVLNLRDLVDACMFPVKGRLPLPAAPSASPATGTG